MDDKLVTLKTFTYSSDASILQGLLESEGIRCFIQDEFIAQSYSNAVGGVKLQILESELELAVKILKENGQLEENTEQSSSSNSKWNNFFKLLFKIK